MVTGRGSEAAGLCQEHCGWRKLAEAADVSLQTCPCRRVPASGSRRPGPAAYQELEFDVINVPPWGILGCPLGPNN